MTALLLLRLVQWLLHCIPPALNAVCLLLQVWKWMMSSEPCGSCAEQQHGSLALGSSSLQPAMGLHYFADINN